ncbi:MAG: questin oxidase family protein [Chloroflexi bacterium]|nr:questin oxidase family protein [Chloroflexota bacterium]
MSVDRHTFLDDLIRTFADIYLANVQAGSRAPIAFIHGVTGPHAVRLLINHVDNGTGDELLVRVWQATAGIYSAYGEPGAVSTYDRNDQSDVEDIVEQAIRTADEHAIKFVETCLDEHRRHPATVFLAAAADAAARLMS